MSTACIEMATRLGKVLAASPQATALVAAQKKLTEDPATRQVLHDYQEQAIKMARLEQSQQPISPDDKHKIQQINDKLIASDLYKQFLDAQVGYVDLMRKTNLAIRNELPQMEV